MTRIQMFDEAKERAQEQSKEIGSIIYIMDDGVCYNLVRELDVDDSEWEGFEVAAEFDNGKEIKRGGVDSEKVYKNYKAIYLILSENTSQGSLKELYECYSKRSDDTPSGIHVDWAMEIIEAMAYSDGLTKKEVEEQTTFEI